MEALALEQLLSRIEVSLEVLHADVTWLVAHRDGEDPVRRLIKVSGLFNARFAAEAAGGTGASLAPPSLSSLHRRLRRIEHILESAQADLGQLLARRDKKSPLSCFERINTFVEGWMTGEGLLRWFRGAAVTGIGLFIAVLVLVAFGAKIPLAPAVRRCRKWIELHVVLFPMWKGWRQ